MPLRPFVCATCLRRIRPPSFSSGPPACARRLSRTLATSAAAPPHRSSPASKPPRRVRAYPKEPAPIPWQLPRRGFSNTVHCILNPRKDEEGNNMDIAITPRAAHRLKQIMHTDTNPDLALRITVESGGCHGFQYLMSLTDGSKISSTDDSVFESDYNPPTSSTSAPSNPADPDGLSDEGMKSDDNRIREAKARVVMDEASLELLKGSTVDYTMELIGSQFKIVGNPRATSSCGCGTSFDVKI